MARFRQSNVTWAGASLHLTIGPFCNDPEDQKVVGFSFERTRAGLDGAKARGAKFGRKPKLSQKQIVHARKLTKAGKHSRAETAELFNVGRKTLYRRSKPREEHKGQLSRPSPPVVNRC